MKVIYWVLILAIVSCIANIWGAAFVVKGSVTSLSGFDKAVGLTGLIILLIDGFGFLVKGDTFENIEVSFGWAVIFLSIFTGSTLADFHVNIPPEILGSVSLGMIMFLVYHFQDEYAPKTTMVIMSVTGLVTALAAWA